IGGDVRQHSLVIACRNGPSHRHGGVRLRHTRSPNHLPDRPIGLARIGRLLKALHCQLHRSVNTERRALIGRSDLAFHSPKPSLRPRHLILVERRHVPLADARIGEDLLHHPCVSSLHIPPASLAHVLPTLPLTIAVRVAGGEVLQVKVESHPSQRSIELTLQQRVLPIQSALCVPLVGEASLSASPGSQNHLPQPAVRISTSSASGSPSEERRDPLPR